MKNRYVKLSILGIACFAFATIAWSSRNVHEDVIGDLDDNPMSSVELPDEAKSQAAFLEAFAVFMSPRCANCHPAGDTPTQGDPMTLHTQGVTRGKDGKGVYGQKCTTCH